MDSSDLYVGVDVGTGSVRCAVVSSTGQVLSTAVKTITTFNPAPDYYQQSSNNIWEATCSAVKDAMNGRKSCMVKGIGFDATCSLVVLDKNFKPLSVSPKGELEQNVILWMDHRAAAETDEINSHQFELLKFVGGKISVEMQPPKILWLKKNLGEHWNNVGHLFDLPDYLTWRATGSLTRSLCSVVCKIMFQANEKETGWDSNFWKSILLEELLVNDFEKIGQKVLAPGSPCGSLTSVAATDLGLNVGTPVGTSMIDAHAGGIGCLGCQADGITVDFSSRLVMICGTSTCHMAVSKNAVFVPGVWGPYYSAMVPGLWLNEAGQSAAGALIDHIINTHPALKDFKATLKDKHIHTGLNDYLHELASMKNVSSVSRLTTDLHVWPDFHGNRSPIADPTLKGVISGLSLSSGEENLSLLYLATLQSLAYGTLNILRALQASGPKIESIIMCGGLAKNSLYTQIHADVTGLPVLIPDEEESVLLGAAILGAAARTAGNLQNVMRSMGGKAIVLLPNQADKRYHEKKFEVFMSLYKMQKNAKEVMKEYA